MLREIKSDTFHYFIDEQNRKQGEYKTFHDNGKPWVHTFLVNDKPHGEYKIFHYNGGLYEQSYFQYGKRHGKYESHYYFKSEQLCVQSSYQNGKLHGAYKHYHDNGIIHISTFYYQGTDLKVDPNTLTEKDKAYMLLSGRLPHRE